MELFPVGDVRVLRVTPSTAFASGGDAGGPFNPSSTIYVIENSYLVKADVEKSGASHDH